MVVRNKLALNILLTLIVIVSNIVMPVSQPHTMSPHSMQEESVLVASSSDCCDVSMHEPACSACIVHCLVPPMVFVQTNATFLQNIAPLINNKPIRRIESLRRPPKAYESIA